ncbi:MAG: radical SAM family heme chaperone HemW [Clostridiales bacterium]|jgi:oxygen-independent coproporphyrinogen-3 oxidase|nr:radical SAM family heme chaperone HemW [Clostridiales bacterium]
MTKKDISVYIHIPFCKSRCFYCDFVSNLKNEKEIALYVNSLCREINNNKILKEFKIKTLYIGGGTPSFIDKKYIYKILSCFDLNNAYEITIETNPESLTLEKILFYKKNRINRISIGLQTTNNLLLKQINRKHDLKTFNEIYFVAKKYFKNINIDLIFGLPDQTLEMFYRDIRYVVNIKPTHISLYSLKIEKNTVFFGKKLNLPDEETERKMYHDAIGILKKSKYYQYEISNFSVKNFECKHNLIYWTSKNYLGFGLSAHSFINNQRFKNTSNFYKYIKNPLNGVDKMTTLTNKNLIEEFVFLGLRLNVGVSKFNFYKKFKIKINEVYDKEIKKLKKEKILIENKKSIVLTKLGFDLANYAMSQFIFD